MSNNPVAEALTHVLADSYALYLKTQNYHWNVEGVHFKTLHELFEEQYTELAAAVDEIAERVRALGAKAPGSFTAFNKLTTLSAGDAEKDDLEMVAELHDDQFAVAKSLNAALNAAQKADDEVTIGLLVDRLSVHEKAAWMLRSSLPKAERAKLSQAA